MHPIRKLSSPSDPAVDAPAGHAPAGSGYAPARSELPGADQGDAEQADPSRLEMRQLDTGQDGDRRSEPRHAQLFRPVTVIADGGEQTVQLMTLSLRGASARTTTPLKPGTSVAMVFATGDCMPATVRWSKSGTSGFHFPYPLSLDLLGEAPREERTRQAPRYKTARAGTIRHGDGREFAVEIGNVSSTGFLIVGHAQLHPGAHVQVCCGSMRPLTCEVRWVRNDHAGLQSSEAISLDEFHDATSLRS